jgi:hypothetical protein
MANYERIVRECFWDSHLSKEEIEQILSGSNQRDKKHVFEKILLNSSHYLLDLRLFSPTDLHTFLEDYSPPSFNYDHAFRRKNLAEVFFFDKKLEIRELQWTT